ncbi:MAG: hypothetical protein ACRCYO_13980 [Bacteroidia bacterium]
MKHLFLFLILPLFAFASFPEAIADFDKQLNDVVAEFKTNVMDQQKSQATAQKAADLAERISDAMNEDGVSKTDRKKLDELKKETEAIEAFITAVGDSEGGFATAEKMNLANNRIRSEMNSVQKGDFCAGVMEIIIGDFSCYLAENSGKEITAVTYRWKGPNGTKSGSGTVNVFASSVHPMYNNRKDPETKKITVMSMSCKEK